jgi:hypothetical protein
VFIAPVYGTALPSSPPIKGEGGSQFLSNGL